MGRWGLSARTLQREPLHSTTLGSDIILDLIAKVWTSFQEHREVLEGLENLASPTQQVALWHWAGEDSFWS